LEENLKYDKVIEVLNIISESEMFSWF
jgi:hypothetical protein